MHSTPLALWRGVGGETFTFHFLQTRSIIDVGVVFSVDSVEHVIRRVEVIFSVGDSTPVADDAVVLENESVMGFVVPVIASLNERSVTCLLEGLHK